jgi:hypothetical protein
MRRKETKVASFVLVFHGGETPEEPSPERWMAWFSELGEAVVDMGAPFGASADHRVDGTPSGGSGPDTTTYRLIDGEPLQVLHDGEPVTVSTVGPALRPTRKKPAAL